MSLAERDVDRRIHLAATLSAKVSYAAGYRTGRVNGAFWSGLTVSALWLAAIGITVLL